MSTHMSREQRLAARQAKVDALKTKITPAALTLWLLFVVFLGVAISEITETSAIRIDIPDWIPAKLVWPLTRIGMAIALMMADKTGVHAGKVKNLRRVTWSHFMMGFAVYEILGMVRFV